MGCASSTPAVSGSSSEVRATGSAAAGAAAKYAMSEALPSQNSAVEQPAAAVNGGDVAKLQQVSVAAAASPGASTVGAGSARASIEAKQAAPTSQAADGPAPVSQTSQQQAPVSQNGAQRQGQPSPAAASPAVGMSLRGLTNTEMGTVQSLLLKVGNLMQKLAEGRSERTTPIQGLKRALDIIVSDCQAAFASVQLIPEAADVALLAALVGGPDAYLEANRLVRLGQLGTAAEIITLTQCPFLSWNATTKEEPPYDWQQLSVHAGLQHVSAVPIRVQDKVAGLVTIGFKDQTGPQADTNTWMMYMQLIASSLTTMVKDSAMHKYVALVKDLYEAHDVDSLVHKVVSHMRGVLGHSSNQHVWYRVALSSSNNMAATIFDDLIQVPSALIQRNLTNNSTGGSFKMLKEVQAQGGVMRTVVAMKSTVMKISVHNRQQVMIPDVQKLINQSGNVSIDIFNTRLIKPPTSVLVFPLKVKQHIFGVVFCMSSVQTDFSDVSPRLREVCEVMSPHVLFLLSNQLIRDYQNVQAAQPVAPEGGSMSGTAMSRNQSFSGGRSIADSHASQSAESFVFTQSRSSTGALVTGLTEKLNQKRIKSSMDFLGAANLADLQITNCLGEGGFAKVFRGLWRGLVVGIKVVCDDGKNEKMVMKNAHEIAILGALSHPNIVQAYTCMTDVPVHELLLNSFRTAHMSVLSSSAYKYLTSMEDRACHLEVIELCDLGNMSTALKNHVFFVPHPDKMLASVLAANGGVEPSGDGGGSPNAVRPPVGTRIQMRTLLLTLIEVASAMAYLHRMGVVHCDLKPANVLLKSSHMDSRGFTAKVSDFGLSRVEDDDNHSSFPFNSCGTAAYVAPEALICNKKVNSSVDVYAYGILMWEMYTGQRPYGSLKQQQLVEEVVMRGLRPKFPSHTPYSYVNLAQACWSGSAQARPSFEEVLSALDVMLRSLDDKDGGSLAMESLASLGDGVEYMSPSGTYAVRGSMGGTPGTAGVAAIPGQYTAIQGGPPAVPLPPGAIPPQQQHFNNPQPLSPRNGLGPTAAAAMNGPGSQYSHLSQVTGVAPGSAPAVSANSASPSASPGPNSLSATAATAFAAPTQQQSQLGAQASAAAAAAMVAASRSRGPSRHGSMNATTTVTNKAAMAAVAHFPAQPSGLSATTYANGLQTPAALAGVAHGMGQQAVGLVPAVVPQ